MYGAIIGVLAHKTLKWAETRGYIDRDNFFAYGFGLALFTLGTTGLYGSDDILACFVAGNAFTWKDWYRVRTQEEEEDTFQDIIDSLLNAAIFIYIGAIIPWDAYNTGGTSLGISPWRIVVLGITVLVLRRLPGVFALQKAIPAVTSVTDAAFAGWFGPVGVGALFYIQVALREIPDDGTRTHLREVYNPVVLFIIFSSVLAHGVTVPLSKLGPGILRRTTTFSQRRTISFTQRPTPKSLPTGSEEKSDGSSGEAGGSDSSKAPSEKRVWNPFFAAYEGASSVLLFWRKDSFWRRENEHQRRNRVIQSDNISKPMHAIKQSTMPERQATQDGILNNGPGTSAGGESSGSADDAEGVDSRTQTTDGSEAMPAVQMPQKPSAAAGSRDTESVAKSGTPSMDEIAAAAAAAGQHEQAPHKQTLWKYLASGDLPKDLYEALQSEMVRERQEAMDESANGRRAEASTSQPGSAPDMAGGSGRVHFHS